MWGIDWDKAQVYAAQRSAHIIVQRLMLLWPLEMTSVCRTEIQTHSSKVAAIKSYNKFISSLLLDLRFQNPSLGFSSTDFGFTARLFLQATPWRKYEP